MSYRCYRCIQMLFLDMSGIFITEVATCRHLHTSAHSTIPSRIWSAGGSLLGAEGVQLNDPTLGLKKLGEKTWKSIGNLPGRLSDFCFWLDLNVQLVLNAYIYNSCTSASTSWSNRACKRATDVSQRGWF
jgi:hypothetical protein